jgi:hypothetical protein
MQGLKLLLKVQNPVYEVYIKDIKKKKKPENEKSHIICSSSVHYISFSDQSLNIVSLQPNNCSRYDSPSKVDQLNVISLTKMTLCTALF